MFEDAEKYRTLLTGHKNYLTVQNKHGELQNKQHKKVSTTNKNKKKTLNRQACTHTRNVVWRSNNITKIWKRP